ncbi:hypothetical protein [Pleomorphomonas koreensis]|uniref:hypothetical protein n=1 Tax=Pleomorphomonas koreensis TaxID=257440 RepID=UPI000414669B|nr:hypothetical protein [Pleomorphomonas koreensis]
MAISDVTFLTIKSATRDLVRDCGGVMRAGRIASVSDTTVSRWQTPGNGDVITIMAALALEAECGVPWVTSAMAEANGCRLGDPSGGGAVPANLQRLHAEADLAMSETGMEIQRALEDGHVTPGEAEVIDRKAAKSEQKLRAVRQRVAVLKVVGGREP